MFGHSVTLGCQGTSQFGHQFLSGVFLRTERSRFYPVEYAFRTGRMCHFMEQRSVECLSGFELTLFRHDDFILRNGIVGTVLVLRPDRTYPKVILNHRIDRGKAELFSRFLLRLHIFRFEFLPQLRPCFLQVGLCHVEDAEHLHLRIDIVFLLLIFGQFLVAVILDFSFVSL